MCYDFEEEMSCPKEPRILKWVEIRGELDNLHLHRDFVMGFNLNLTPTFRNSKVHQVGSVNGLVPYWLKKFHGPFLNGCVHWIALDEDSLAKLCAFDIDNETFYSRCLRGGTGRVAGRRTPSIITSERDNNISRRSRSPRTSVFSRIRRERSRSPRQRSKEGGVFKRVGSRGKSVSARSNNYNRNSHSKYTEAFSESEDSEGGHRKSRSKGKKSRREEDDLSQPWVCEEVDPFTPRIHYFDFLKTRMPSHIKTYDGSKDPEDHLKIFQEAAKTEQWAMPTWCHMFNFTLMRNARVWFDDLSPESIDSYDDLEKAFLENYL
ncbi:hypothetical protein Tco_1510040 [Tanacetum coccineum]